MLAELAKRDSEWRKLALSICGNKQLADEIVQEMYLTILSRNKNRVNTSYVFYCMKYIFVNMIRKDKVITEVDMTNFQYQEEDNSLDDEEMEILSRCDKVPFHEREITRNYYDKSIRQIAREINVNRQFVYRAIKKTRNNVLNG